VNPASLRYAVTGFVSASASIIMVPGGGLEPPRPYGQRILSPLRLPIPPPGLQVVNQHLM
jgi:hypothetical protein